MNYDHIYVKLTKSYLLVIRLGVRFGVIAVSSLQFFLKFTIFLQLSFYYF